MHSPVSTKYTNPHIYYDFEWATKLNQLTLNILGIWPNFRETIYDKYLSDLRATFSIIFIVSIGVVPAMYSLVKTGGDMMLLIDNLQLTLPLWTSIVKLIVVWWKKTDLTFVLNMISDDWLKSKSDQELRVMIKRAKNARAISIFGCTLMILGFCIIVILFPCFGKTLSYRTNATKILPLQIDYFYEQDQSPYFELTFTAQCFMFVLTGASYSGVDSLFGLLLFHLCGQIENIKDRLSKMERSKNFNDDLAFIVKDHIRVIKFFDIVENSFTLLLLTLLLSFGILFCLHGFLIVTVFTEGREISIFRLIYLLSIMLNICVHMCLYCLVGELLVTQCEEMFRAVYNFEWYTLEPGNARILILIMIRTSRPLFITAGKIFPMTMSTFCNLLKTSGGYVSVLLASRQNV